jgi:hypothetical protein
MATEKIEIEIIAKGKPAEKAIKGIDKQTKTLGSTTKNTGKSIDTSVSKMKESWSGLGVKIAAVSLALGASVVKAKGFERASIGLTKAQRDWAMSSSLATEATAEQVAGFLKSAQTAGLAEDAQRSLATSAIALGYAFPHEQAETLHDNLIMLSTTGEAQGFIVDILEQKLAALGIAFKDIDLKALPVSEKLKLINEVVRDSQKAMDESKYTELNTSLGTMSNTITNLGDKLVEMGSDSGAFATLTATVQVFSGFVLLAADRLGALVNWSKELIGITNEQSEASIRENAILEKINKERKTGVDLIKEMEERRAKSVQALENAKESGASKEIIKWLEKEQRSLDKTIRKHKERLNIAMRGSKQVKLGEVTASGSHIMTDVVIEGSAEGERLAAIMKKAEKPTKDLKKSFNDLNDVGKTVATNLDHAFTSFASGAKFSFKDMTKSILADLLRIQVRKSIVGLLSNVFPALHTGTAEVKHTGGAIGLSSIPSFHTGVRSDERIAKLQVGEAVVNRGGAAKNRGAIDAMNSGYSVGGGGNVTTAEINFNVTAIDSASFNNYLVGNKHVIENIINRSLQTNGTVRQTIKQVV